MYQRREINSVDGKDIYIRIRKTTAKFIEILISGNFEITMKQIKNIKCEVNELKKHRIYRRVLQERVQSIETKISSLEEKVDEIYDYQIDPDEIEKKAYGS